MGSRLCLGERNMLVQAGIHAWAVRPTPLQGEKKHFRVIGTEFINVIV
jgi:hypothetical protein